MGKKKDKAATRGGETLSKKELKKREAYLEQEIARREAERKAAKKAKKAAATAAGETAAPEAGAGITFTATAEAPIVGEEPTQEPTPEPVEEPTGDAVMDAEIRARVLRRRAMRASAAAEGTEAGSPERVEAMQRNVEASIAERYAGRIRFEARESAQSAEAPAETSEAPAETSGAQVAEVVETDHGREFAVGTTEAADFAKPSEAPQTDFSTNGNGQYLVARPGDGKVVGYPRVTTYIDCLEDKSMLEKWRSRVLLEGVSASDSAEVVATISGLVHNRDVAIEKARRKDRKGKLEPGELATYVAAAEAAFRTAMDNLSAELFEVGGGHEKAAKGTDLHALCARAAVEGVEPIRAMFEAEEIGASDIADVEAFLGALDALGAKVLEVERPVVNDEIKVAGRLDYVVMVKLPGEVRARRRVLDLKTGRVDYSPGKIAMQLALYASSIGYDLETHEREPLGLDQKAAILLHLPAGSGKATAHVVDLALARKGVALAGSVRSWRNEGKRAIDLKSNLLTAVEKVGE